MRIVATSDTHFPFSAEQIPDGDVFIHAGDLMYSGYPDEWYPRVESLAAIDHKVKIYVPGNHDYHLQNYEAIAVAELRKQAKTTVVGLPHRPMIVLPNGMRALCIPFATNITGWAFCVSEDWLYDYLRDVQREHGVPDIVVSHAPMYGVLDAIHPEAKQYRAQEHVGSMAFNKWFYSLDNKPKVWIHGHIHEDYGRKTVEGCTFYNVAMCDPMYTQENKPMVIDLE